MSDEFDQGFDESEPDLVAEQLSAREEKLGIAWGFVAALVFASLLAIFVVQNTEEITVEFLWIELRMSVWIVIMIAVLLTLIFDQLISISWRRRRRKERRRTREESTEQT